MRKRNEAIPTAAERVAESLPLLRTAYGDHQSLAAAMTALGVPTKESTLSRIESGRQPPTVDELLLFAILGGGLRDTLSGPLRIGNVEIPDIGDLFVRDASPAVTLASIKAMDVAHNNQERQLAAVLEVDPDDVAAAASELYAGRRMSEEINFRVTDRNMRSADEYALPGSAVWQAYRTHAVRAVRREIADHLEEKS